MCLTFSFLVWLSRVSIDIRTESHASFVCLAYVWNIFRSILALWDPCSDSWGHPNSLREKTLSTHAQLPAQGTLLAPLCWKLSEWGLWASAVALGYFPCALPMPYFGCTLPIMSANHAFVIQQLRDQSPCALRAPLCSIKSPFFFYLLPFTCL